MKNLTSVFITCVLLNLLIGFIMINMNFKPNKKKGLYGENGPEGVIGNAGNIGNIGDRFKLDSCGKIKKITSDIKNVIIENNNDINQSCVDKINAKLTDIYNKNKSSFDFNLSF
jgi:ankyrin repeat protein